MMLRGPQRDCNICKEAERGYPSAINSFWPHFAPSSNSHMNGWLYLSVSCCCNMPPCGSVTFVTSADGRHDDSWRVSFWDTENRWSSFSWANGLESLFSSASICKRRAEWGLRNFSSPCCLNRVHFGRNLDEASAQSYSHLQPTGHKMPFWEEKLLHFFQNKSKRFQSLSTMLLRCLSSIIISSSFHPFILQAWLANFEYRQPNYLKEKL